MSPLAEKIASLLAPEYWAEWHHWEWGMMNLKRGLSISTDPLSILLGPEFKVHLTDRLSWWERRRIRKLALTMDAAQQEGRYVQEVEAAEHAIEELLKP